MMAQCQLSWTRVNFCLILFSNGYVGSDLRGSSLAWLSGVDWSPEVSSWALSPLQLTLSGSQSTRGRCTGTTSHVDVRGLRFRKAVSSFCEWSCLGRNTQTVGRSQCAEYDSKRKVSPVDTWKKHGLYFSECFCLLRQSDPKPRQARARDPETWPLNLQKQTVRIQTVSTFFLVSFELGKKWKKCHSYSAFPKWTCYVFGRFGSSSGSCEAPLENPRIYLLRNTHKRDRSTKTFQKQYLSNFIVEKRKWIHISWNCLPV